MGGPPDPLFSLAPDWVYRAPSVTLRAVGSYPTFSPLPCSFYPPWRYIFCDTIRHSQLQLKTPSLSQGILPCGVRTFLSNCKNQSECFLPENRSLNIDVLFPWASDFCLLFLNSFALIADKQFGCNCHISPIHHSYAWRLPHQ